MINFLVGIILGPITYGVLHLYYRGGTMPVVGSILDLFFYIVYTGLVMICGMLGFNVFLSSLVVCFYLVVLMMIVRDKNYLFY